MLERREIDYPHRQDNEAHPVILTLTPPPGGRHFFVLELQGERVPRKDYRLLRDVETGDPVIVKLDATWLDCCQAAVKYIAVPRSAEAQIREELGEFCAGEFV